MSKTVVITGASRGLGLATANLFSSRGWNVIDLSRNSKKTPVDITDVNALDKIFNNINNIDVLINNAGIFEMSKFSNTNIDNIQQIINVNLIGAMNVTKFALNKMKAGSKIIFVNSVAGLSEIVNQSIYCASKHGLTAFAGVLGQELRADGIVVSSIHPGGINTPLWNNSNPYPAGNSNLALDPTQVADTIYYITQTDNNTIIKNITLFPNIEWH